ncbi:MAG TPA: c-type cytochrome [Candidatus Binatia bacterium]
MLLLSLSPSPIGPGVASATDPAVVGEAATVIPQAARDEADSIWKSRCSTCHGDGGKGDGAAAAALTPHPRDFTQQSWQSSVSDEHIEKIIAEGGQAVGLSMLMPANPDLVAKPDVIKALRAHVRSLGGH